MTPKRKGHESLPCYENQCDHPQSKANFISRLLFWWTNDMFKQGSQRPLGQSDFWPLREQEHTCHLTKLLYAQWITDIKGKESKNPRLWKSVMRGVSRKDLCIVAFAGLLDAIGRFLQPLFLGIFISTKMSNTPNQSLLLGCAVLVFLTVAIKGIAAHHCSFRLYIIGMRVKASLKGVIFMKMFLLGQHTLQDFTKGHVIDLVTNDVQRMEQAPRQFFRFVVAIFNVSMVIPLLLCFMGWQGLMGLIFLFLLVPFGCFLSYWSGVIRRKTAAVSDRRISLISEIVAGIREVKTHAWEWFFRDQIRQIRREEIKMIRYKSILNSFAISLMFTSGLVAAFASVMALAFTGVHLTPFNVFILLSFINVLRNNALRSIGEGSQFIYEAYVSFDRIQEFLMLINLHWFDEGSFTDAEHSSSPQDFTNLGKYPVDVFGEVSSANRNGKRVDQNQKPMELIIDPKKVSDRTNVKLEETGMNDSNLETNHIIVSNVSCKLNGFEKRLIESITFTAQKNDFVVITGPVGSGKSTLLSTIAKLIPITEGKILRRGTIAFVPQVPWVFSGTVHENIVFGQFFDQDRYAQVLKACALDNDIEGFPEKDQTVVGERGNTLSGGQITRVSLARAVYANCDIYLLDDLLKALDAKVRNHIFNCCIRELLSEKIRIFVSHEEHHMRMADRVILLHQGRVTSPGNFEELYAKGDLCGILQQQYSNKSFETKRMNFSNKANNTPATVSLTNELASKMRISEEDRMIGTISCKLYWEYLRAGTHPILIAGLALIFLIAQGIMVSPDVWLTFLAKRSHKDQTDFTNVAVYAGCVSAVIFFTTLRAYLFFLATLRSSERLHDNMAVAVLKSPVLFFDSNADGRILNRFSKDIGCMDEVLPKTFLFAIQMILFVLTAALIPVVANRWLAAIVATIVLMYFYIAKYYLKTAREIKRLEAVLRSPVLSHISETLDGLNTIRSREKHREFIERFYRYQDRHNQAYYMVLAGNRWLGIRLDFLSAILIGAVTLVAALHSRDEALVGLALVYVFETAHYTQTSVQQSSEVENLMTSVERVLSFTKLESEPGYSSETRPPDGWPNYGEVKFSDVSLQYYLGGPQVLTNLSVRIDRNSKIGIVGRTGAGKSSIVSALLPMSEPEGLITVDGVRVKDLNLQDVRRYISVFNQSPMVFSGTLRQNLDPLEQHDDAELWAALQAVHLNSFVSSSEGQLDYLLTEKGTNLSVGEKHLVCLARVLLQNNKIMVLDEPTAHVDPITEKIIQDTVRERLKHCTVITVAHRLTTIQHCDKIMVLRDGEVVEYDRLDALAGQEEGVFAEMIRISHEDL